MLTTSSNITAAKGPPHAFASAQSALTQAHLVPNHLQTRLGHSPRRRRRNQLERAMQRLRLLQSLPHRSNVILYRAILLLLPLLLPRQTSPKRKTTRTRTKRTRRRRDRGSLDCLEERSPKTALMNRLMEAHSRALQPRRRLRHSSNQESLLWWGNLCGNRLLRRYHQSLTRKLRRLLQQRRPPRLQRRLRSQNRSTRNREICQDDRASKVSRHRVMEPLQL